MDYGKSKTVAIQEFCRGCLQSQSAADCPDRGCALFPFRPGADSKDATQRRPGRDVPTREWYEDELRKQDPDGLKAETARVRFAGGKVAEAEVEEEEPEW